MNITPKNPNRPVCQSESELFYRYFHFVWAPAVEKAWSELIVEPMSGCISISFHSEGRGYGLYATPCWEEEINHILWSVSDDNGNYLENGEIPFPIDGWTMEVDKDVDRYILTMKTWMETVLPTIMWKILHTNRKKA